MRRDSDYLRSPLEVFATLAGAAIAVGVCRLVIALVEVLGW